MARLKTARDISGIYASGQITGRFLAEVGARIAPGVTTGELDLFAKEYINKHNATAAFLNYKGFPGHICTSINEQIVHGIPGQVRLQKGDLLSIDVGVILDGYFSDAAHTYVVGNTELDEERMRLMDGTRRSLYAGIAAIGHNVPLRMISREIEQVLTGSKLGIIRELTGHGTGFALHEEPTIYNFDTGSRLPLIENGSVVAIEPMATLGSEAILLGSDNWTYSTADGSLAAHFEHTVACWDDRAFVLTDPHDDDARQAFG